MTEAVKKSSVVLGVPLLLQPEILLTTMLVISQGEQETGAVPALLLVKVHAVAEKLAVKPIIVPSALIVTPVKVWLVPLKVPVVAAPSPVRIRLPVAGGLA